jgi:arabinofuranosyltransferase
VIRARISTPSHVLSSARVVAALLFTLFSAVLLRTAWISDDAAITFRVVLNLAHGFGPNYNLTERVQAYTHPLWFALLALAHAALGNIYYAAFLLSFGCSLLAFWLIGSRLATSRAWAVLASLVLILSKAFVDYSTSGLENALAHLLLALFVLLFLRAPESSPWYLGRLVLLCSLIYLTRPDMVLLVLPMLALAVWRVRNIRHVITQTLMGLLPLVLWTLCSLIYYGFPFPNTAYAKLDNGIGRWDLFSQGIQYLLDSLDRDPLTLIAISLGVALGFAHRAPLTRALSAGIVLYMVYITSIGSDFMSGRFFSVPLFAAAIIFARLPALRPTAFALLALSVLLIGITSPYATLLSDSRFSNDKLTLAGIADERGFFYQRTGLLSGNRDRFQEPVQWAGLHGGAPDVVDVREVCGGLGFIGLDAGPWVFFIDRCGLSDPLLARLPPKYNPNWRIGHFERVVPDGYAQSVRGSTNELTDVNLRQYYEVIRLITQGPLFSGERLAAIVRMNLGQYDYLIDRARYMAVPNLTVGADQTATIKPEGTPWNATGNITIQPYVPLTVAFGGVQLDKHTLDISLDHNDTYLVTFLKEGQTVGTLPLGPHLLPNGGLARYAVKIPASVSRDGFDAIMVTPLGGDGSYSVGHLVVTN